MIHVDWLLLDRYGLTPWLIIVPAFLFTLWAADYARRTSSKDDNENTPG